MVPRAMTTWAPSPTGMVSRCFSTFAASPQIGWWTSTSTPVTRPCPPWTSVASRMTWQCGTIMNRFLTSSTNGMPCAASKAAVRAAVMSSGMALNLFSGKRPET